MYFDPLYLVFFVPALLLSLWASWRTKSAFKKYSRVRTLSGLTGAEAAKRLLASAGITDVDVVQTRGVLSDHYDPRNKKLALSEPVYGSPSVAAVGVACHEAGHAIQHAENYGPLGLRSLLVPTANIGSKLGYMVMFAGLMMMFFINQQFGQTVVLIGAVSAHYPPVPFAVGAMTASFVFFFSLGFGARLLAPLFARPGAWRVLDAGVAALMWAIALSLLLG